MKRNVIFFCALFFCLVSGAQNPLYLKIRQILVEEHPELSLNDKLIAYTAWSLEDAESRALNQGFDDVYGIYQVAKLKGGAKGLIVVSIHLDGTDATAATTLYHDGAKKVILIDGSRLRQELKGAPANMVFDSAGREVYRNLSTADVRASINKLITR
jgi:hypothetical protein